MKQPDEAEKIRAAFDRLTQRQQRMLYGYHAGGLSCAELARQFNCTTADLSRELAKASTRLRVDATDVDVGRFARLRFWWDLQVARWWFAFAGWSFTDWLLIAVASFVFASIFWDWALDVREEPTPAFVLTDEEIESQCVGEDCL